MDEWLGALADGEFVGVAELKRADGGTVAVQYAAHPEVVTGGHLVLLVELSISRAGRHFRREAHTEVVEALSDRELEVVSLVASGASGPEIAEQLHISHNTVRTHVRNAMEKIGARSRAHLVAKSLGEGIVLP